MNLENGNKIVLEAPDNSPENRYIGAVQFDGKAYTHNFLRHSDLVKGAGVRFSMRPEPDYTRGTEPGMPLTRSAANSTDGSNRCQSAAAGTGRGGFFVFAGIPKCR